MINKSTVEVTQPRGSIPLLFALYRVNNPNTWICSLAIIGAQNSVSMLNLILPW